MTETELVVPLEGELPVTQVGGKASALAAAVAAKLPVPWGFAVTVAGMAALDEPALRAAVDGALEGRQGPFAVRSSAIDEDSAQTGSAGVYQTVLGVPAEGVHDALRTVGESAHSPRALSYRSRHALAEPTRMAAVVESLVLADAAGVAFSRHPVDGRPVFLVESVWGLGESVVSGTVTPDRFLLEHLDSAPHVTPARKASELRLVDRVVEEVPVDATRQHRPSLDAAAVRAVAALAVECEGLAGGPCEMEWAQRGGVLSLLQFRRLSGGFFAAELRSDS
jgi:pyruvate, water dikinase